MAVLEGVENAPVVHRVWHANNERVSVCTADSFYTEIPANALQGRFKERERDSSLSLPPPSLILPAPPPTPCFADSRLLCKDLTGEPCTGTVDAVATGTRLVPMVSALLRTTVGLGYTAAICSCKEESKRWRTLASERKKSSWPMVEFEVVQKTKPR